VRDGVITGFVHSFSVHEGEREGFESSVNVHKVKGGDWGSLGDEGDVCWDKIGGANVIDKDGVMKIVTLCEEAVEGVCELGGKNDRFPFGMVRGSIEMGHRIVEAFLKIRVRRGRP